METAPNIIEESVETVVYFVSIFSDDCYDLSQLPSRESTIHICYLHNQTARSIASPSTHPPCHFPRLLDTPPRQHNNSIQAYKYPRHYILRYSRDTYQ